MTIINQGSIYFYRSIKNEIETLVKLFEYDVIRPVKYVSLVAINRIQSQELPVYIF
jgi:hypothetical protein